MTVVEAPESLLCSSRFMVNFYIDVKLHDHCIHTILTSHIMQVALIIASCCTGLDLGGGGGGGGWHVITSSRFNSCCS